MLPACFLVGWLALGGVIMNIVRGQRKPKSYEFTKAKVQALDPGTTYTIAEDGELIEVGDRKRKQRDDDC